jgi:hypothetical protein
LLYLAGMRKLVVLAAMLSLSTPAMASPFGKVLDATVKPLFEKLAAKKQARVFHADGQAYHATMRDASGHERPAIVRLSRGGAGKPGKPDILGIAVKTKGADGQDQDVLMVSSFGQKGLGARVPRFRGTLAGSSVSSLTSFKYEGVKGAITAKLPDGFRTALDVQGSGKGPARQSFQMQIRQAHLFRAATQTQLGGEVTVHFDQPLTAAESKGLEFTPMHDGAGVKPVGIVNKLRQAAYPGSEEGRGLKPVQ